MSDPLVLKYPMIFDACDPDATWTAVEFAQWLDVEVQAALHNRVPA